MKKGTFSFTNLLILLVLLSLYAYVISRAYSLSFTHDESLSFSVINGDAAFIDTANNHLLNTGLMRITACLFGKSEFALRLPNVLAFPLYFAVCLAIFRGFKKPWLSFLGIGFVLLNPFVLEFFSLARGYGLSITFMMVSLFFLVKKGLSQNNYFYLLRDFALSVLFASLAIFANLSMINFFIGILSNFRLGFCMRHIEKYLKISKLSSFFS